MSDSSDRGSHRRKNEYEVDLVLDSADGDFTVRPCPPHLRPILEAERERLIKAGILKLPDPPKPDEPQ